MDSEIIMGLERFSLMPFFSPFPKTLEGIDNDFLSLKCLFQISSAHTCRNIIQPKQMRVSWKQGESQATSNTPFRGPQVSEILFNCSFSGSFVMPASTLPDSPVHKGGRWLSGIKWETKGDKANMSFLVAYTSRKEKSVSLSCFLVFQLNSTWFFLLFLSMRDKDALTVWRKHSLSF